eukprot:6191462-Pyramimonas_sp.AAC.1
MQLASRHQEKSSRPWTPNGTAPRSRWWARPPSTRYSMSGSIFGLTEERPSRRTSRWPPLALVHPRAGRLSLIHI